MLPCMATSSTAARGRVHRQNTGVRIRNGAPASMTSVPCVSNFVNT